MIEDINQEILARLGGFDLRWNFFCDASGWWADQAGQRKAQNRL